MVNIFNITVSPTPLPTPVLQMRQLTAPNFVGNFFTNKVSMNFFSSTILKFLADKIVVRVIDLKDIPKRALEHSPGCPPIANVVTLENFNFYPMEQRMGKFFVLYQLTTEDQYICQVSVYFDKNNKRVYLYEPEINPVLDFCKFSTY